MKNLTKKLILKANYLLGHYRDVLWLVGAGRSGTTWVSGLINHGKNYREMFEPFHPTLVPALNFLIENQYIRPHMLDKKIKKTASRIFNGSFTDKRVDDRTRSFLYRGLLIKDIAANLFCFAMCCEFAHIKPVLLIRNPFAVALSKFKTKNWNWPSEPLELLHQKDLREDYLTPFEDLIEKTSAKKNYLLNQILIWAITYYVPLCQFNQGDVLVCFYEDIYTAPEREIARIMHFTKGGKTSATVNLPEKLVKQPSWVSGTKTNVVQGTSPITSWKTELDTELISEALNILDYFGLAELYDDIGMPVQGAVEKLQKKQVA